MIATGFDIETTGIEQAKGHRMIELHCSVYDLTTRMKRISWTKRLNPGRSIDKAAEAVHKISLDMLKDEPEWEVIAPQLKAILDKTDLLIAHNGDAFDIPFVIEEFLRIGTDISSFAEKIKSFDTMLQGRWATANGKVPNLGELCFACDVDYDAETAHAADYDVDVMMKCFFFGLDNGFYTLPEGIEA
jgi:DNA polymerase-3 subunit epsilon